MKKIDNIAQELGFIVKRTCDKCAYYYLSDADGFDIRNSKGEKLCVEIEENINPGGAHALPEMWLNKGYIKERLQSWWGVATYVTDKSNDTYGGRYNPLCGKYNGRPGINFGWVLAATPENFRRIMEEIKRIFLNN